MDSSSACRRTLAVLHALYGRQANLDNLFVLVDMSERDLGELCLVGPQMHTETVDMGRSQEVSGRGECQACRDTARSEGIDQASRRDVIRPYDRVKRRRYQPSRVWREGLLISSGAKNSREAHRVQHSTFETSKLTNHSSRFDIYQANDEIVAYRREKPVVPLKVKLGDRRRQLHLVQKLCGVEVEELRSVSIEPERRRITLT